MKERINKLVYILLITLFIVIFVLSIYLKRKFSTVTTEQIMHSILYSEGTSFDAIKDGLFYVTIRSVIILIILFFIVKIIKTIKTKFYINIKIKTKQIKIDLLKPTKLKKLIILLFLIFISLYSMVKALKIDKYIAMQKSSSTIFEENYVDPKSVKITFPSEKQNLIYIFVESLEMTNISINNGGLLENAYIPELESIALNNDNFSNSELLGGAYKVTGTGWTAASLVAQTSAVPLKLSIDGNEYSGYGQSLPGVYTLGEILEDNGYTNYFLLGSDAKFGGRKDYFSYHGNYKIMDYYYAKENGWIPEDYHKWWGYEDKKLYEFAKNQLKNISKNDEPFNFTMLTADTHFENGYTDESCPKYFENPYANSIYCTDIMLSEFIKWIKRQDFYNNTTIIITGDHLTMQSNFYDKIIPDNYNRTIFNTIINSKIEITNNKNRLFTLFDMYPTTLASLGATIEGDKLGLGTNLYSNKKTIVEDLGYEYVDTELEKKSLFYDNKLLKDTYYKMQEELGEE